MTTLAAGGGPRRKSLFPSFKLRTDDRDFLPHSTAPGTIFHGRTSKEIPTKKLKDVSPQYVSAFAAPPNFMQSVHRCMRCNTDPGGGGRGTGDNPKNGDVIDGIDSWDMNTDYAYGMATSLYERLPAGEYTGDPIADSLAVVTRHNCAIMALADGVSWGQKSKLASNCSIYGSVKYICDSIDDCTNTKDVFRCILKSFESAQSCIVETDATLTTLCVAVIVELQERNKWCLCVVNVGDSYAYIYNKHMGVKEVTHASHPIDEARDMRFSGGALGPVDGYNPDLANLTCSMVTLDVGDIVFLCSDGISDNFDPAVAKFVPRFKAAEIASKSQRISPSPKSWPSASIEENTCHRYSRQRSEGNLETAALRHCNCEKMDPSEIMYFKFDQSPSDPCIVKESIVRDLRQLVTTTTIINNEFDANGSKNIIEKNDVRSGCGIRYDRTSPTPICCLGPVRMSDSNHGGNDTVSDYHNDLSPAPCHQNTDIGALKEEEEQDELYTGITLTPRERHEGALEQMREVINTVEFEPINPGSKTRAVDICAQIMNFVINRTAEKREILEQYPPSMMNEMSPDDKKSLTQSVKERLEGVPGKLDHASIVAYEVGYHGQPIVSDGSADVAEPSLDHTDFAGWTTVEHEMCARGGRRGSEPLHLAILNRGKQAHSQVM